MLERLWVHAEGEQIEEHDVIAVERAACGGGWRVSPGGPRKVAAPTVPPIGRFDAEMDAHARALLDRALNESNGNVSAAARTLGLDRMAFARRLKKLVHPGTEWVGTAG
jgi:transcriptional regulator of acetoin/glycerol metabolism